MGLVTHISAGFRAAGLEPPRARVLSFSIPLHEHLLATGRFLTTLPLSMLIFNQHLPLKVVPVEFPAHGRPVAVLTLKGRTLGPLAHQFVDCARNVAEILLKASQCGQPGQA